MNTNTFRIMVMMFLAAVVMNAMNYFFYGLHSGHRPAPFREDKKIIVLEKKNVIVPRFAEDNQPGSTMLSKLSARTVGTRALSTGSSSASDYDTTTDSLTTTSVFKTVRVESSSYINESTDSKTG